MAIHNVRLPDAAGTPRIVIPETPTSGVPPLPPDAPTSERTTSERDSGVPAPDGRPWYRSEAWLAVELAALLPVLAALVTPQPARVPLVVLSAALIALGLAMLVVRDRRARGRLARR
jgi:hypothetical protein